MNQPEILAPGVLVYRNVFTKEMDLINRLEECLSSDPNAEGVGYSDSPHSTYKWKQATTGYANNDLKYRDAFDFKVKKNNPDDSNKSPDQIKLEKIWEDSRDVQIGPVEDYRQRFNVAPLKYWESFNFVKYEGEGTHFNIHADHGPAYNCTVSAVIYINDDYEGGEIRFPRLDGYTHVPKVGDIAVFPSNYIYEHASLPMKSGTKYCVVVMTDINKLGHPDSQ